MKLRITRFSFRDFLVLSSPFMSGVFYDSPLGNIYFFYLTLAVYLFLHIIGLKNLYIPKVFLYVFTLLLVLTIFGNFLFEIPPKYLVSYLPPIILTFLCYFAYIADNHFDVEAIFTKYFAIAVIFSMFGVLQQVFHLIGTDFLFYFANILKKSGPFVGVTGLSSEPSNFAVALMPAAYFALYRFFILKKFGVGSVLVIVALLMSFSALGVLGILISIIIMLPSLIKRRFIFFAISLPFVIYLTYLMLTTEHMLLRLADTIGGITGSVGLNPKDMNLSTYTLAVNFNIVKTAFLDNNMLGTGVGSYFEVFSKYISDYVTPKHRDTLPGSSSASSLVLKVTAEFGIIGLILLVWLMVKNFSTNAKCYVNHAFFVTLVVIYLRMGTYYVNGIPFVMLMYAHSYIFYRRRNSNTNST